MEEQTQKIPFGLPSGKTIKIETTSESSGGGDVAFPGIPSFEEITETIEEIASIIAITWDKVKPSKAAVEFGVDIGVESGKLTTMIVKGSGKANLKILLEWEQSKKT